MYSGFGFAPSQYQPLLPQRDQQNLPPQQVPLQYSPFLPPQQQQPIAMPVQPYQAPPLPPPLPVGYGPQLPMQEPGVTPPSINKAINDMKSKPDNQGGQEDGYLQGFKNFFGFGEE